MNQSCMMTSLRKVSQIFRYKVDLGKYAKTCCTSVFSLLHSNMIIWLIHMEATELCFPVLLFITQCKVVLTFDSLDEIV